MAEPITRSALSRNRVRILLVAGIVVLIGAGVGVWLGLRGGRDQHIGPIPLAGRDLCADQVRINTDTDAQMMRIARLLVHDRRVKVVYTETKLQALHHFQREYADQPGLVAVARLAAMPADVLVVPVDGVDVTKLGTAYRTQFPDVRDISVQTRS